MQPGLSLSQNEIDSLFKGVINPESSDQFQSNIEENDFISYDLANFDRIIRGRMPTLDIIHDRFVRMFRLSLSSILRKVTDISIRTTELMKFGEFMNTVPFPSSLNLFRINPLRGNAILVMETRLIFSLIDILFGGTGELEVQGQGRDFTPIEQKIIKRLVISALLDLQNAWRPVFPVQITFSRSEINPQFAAVVPQSDNVFVVTFDLEIGKAPMSMILCLPFGMLEPIRAQMQAGFQSDTSEMDSITLRRLRNSLESSAVDLKVQLGKTEISVKEFSELKVGDVLMLNQNTDELLPIIVEGITKFRGQLGAYHGKQSIKINEFIYSPPYFEEFT
ncbi:MAG: flagellar motor switch protein FliM [SAR324 cluster bacterium]|nr:flagellar motor switch protein FliM [SAR324 cluster bacterium]